MVKALDTVESWRGEADAVTVTVKVVVIIVGVVIMLVALFGLFALKTRVRLQLAGVAFATTIQDCQGFTVSS